MLIDLNKTLTREEYLDLSQNLYEQHKVTYGIFIDAIPFNQYYAMTHCGLPSRYDNCLERISKVSKSKKLKALALKADNAYHQLHAFRQAYPKDYIAA